MKTINYIKDNLNRISDKGILEKFDLLLSAANTLNEKNYYSDLELIKDILSSVESLRFEMAYNKGTESVSYRLDKVLVYEALKLSRIIFTGKDLIKYINDVVYYEINESFKEELKQEINLLSQ